MDEMVTVWYIDQKTTCTLSQSSLMLRTTQKNSNLLKNWKIFCVLQIELDSDVLQGVYQWTREWALDCTIRMLAYDF